MAENEPLNNPQGAVIAPKRPKHGGKPAKITAQTVLRVAERVSEGLPLKYALTLENPPISTARWHDKLDKAPRLAAMYDQKIALWVQGAIREIAAAPDLRHMPAKLWLLERRHKEFFGQQREVQNFTINQTVIGLSQDILARGQRLLRKQAKVIDNPAPEQSNEGQPA